MGGKKLLEAIWIDVRCTTVGPDVTRHIRSEASIKVPHDNYGWWLRMESHLQSMPIQILERCVQLFSITLPHTH